MWTSITRDRVATAAVLALVATSLSVSCADSPPAQPVAHRAPRRIVSVVPAVTEMLFAIGAGPRVVGVGTFDRFPPETAALPKVGALLDPDFERLVSLGADFVVVDRGQVELQAKLDRAGIAHFDFATGDLAGVTRTLRELGRAVGAEPDAERVAAQIEVDLTSIARRVDGRPRRRVLLVFGRDPGALRNIYASGGVGFLSDLLELAGGTNVLRDQPREGLQVSTETVLALAPEVILELRYGSAATIEPLVDARRDWQVLSSLPAVRGGCVELLVGDELVVPGPRVAATAERFARSLHPEAFD